MPFIEPGDSDKLIQRAKIDKFDNPSSVISRVDTEPDLSNIKIDPASIAFGDTDLSS